MRFYDRRMLSVGQGAHLNYSSLKGLFSCFGYTKNSEQQSPRSQRITSLQYDNFGNEILVSYQKDRIYLLDWRDTTTAQPEPEAPLEVEEKAENEPENQSQEESQDQAKKNFRIQADWSDTGPQSMPLNEQSNADPRTFMMRRLNDWFQELYTRQSSPPHAQSAPNATANEPESSGEEPSGEQQTPPQQDQQPAGAAIARNLEANAKRLQILASMRDRVRQTVRKENDLMAELPAPKIKMTYRGHRNSRTIVLGAI